MKIILFYLVTINLVALCIMGIDKHRACRHRWRIPEQTLLLLAAVGGSLGTLLGMWLFRHKIRTRIFVFGVPALLVLHLFIFRFIF